MATTRSGEWGHQKKAVNKLCDSLRARFDLQRYKGIEDINPRLNTKGLNIDSAAAVHPRGLDLHRRRTIKI